MASDPTRKGWQITCAPECGFQVRDFDQTDLVKVMQTHMSHAHGQQIDERGVLGMAKAA